MMLMFEWFISWKPFEKYKRARKTRSASSRQSGRHSAGLSQI